MVNSTSDHKSPLSRGYPIDTWVGTKQLRWDDPPGRILYYPWVNKREHVENMNVNSGTKIELLNSIGTTHPTLLYTEKNAKTTISRSFSLQGGAPPVISWFIIPLTIDISTISPSDIRVINQLSYLGGLTL